MNICLVSLYITSQVNFFKMKHFYKLAVIEKVIFLIFVLWITKTITPRKLINTPTMKIRATLVSPIAAQGAE